MVPGMVRTRPLAIPRATARTLGGITTLVLVIAGCVTPSAQLSEAPSISAEASASAVGEPTASPSLTASPAPTEAASPSASAPSGTANIVQVVTDDLVVRSLPGTGAESEIYSPNLSAPTLLYVLDGPVVADGYDWYNVLPFDSHYSDLYTPGPGYGWVAAGGQDGEAWIGPWNGKCPAPSVEELMWLTPLFAWICFADQELILEGTLWECSDAAHGSGWHPGLGDRGCLLVPLGLDPRDLLLGGFRFRVQSAAIDVSPGPGASVQVTGHYTAWDCAEFSFDEDAIGPPQRACALDFVATEITPTSAP